MTDLIQILKDDLEKGYSKSDLERLIGLPKNSLSGIIKGDKKLSKKSEIKIEQWSVSEKPNPLNIVFVKKEVKVTDLNEPTNVVKPIAPIIPKKTNFTINTTNEPKEGSAAFFLKYGVETWEEVKSKK